MNQEWTYRPPVLVGERVVWLGGDTAPEDVEPCKCQPHHGTVSWIGRVSEMGNDWIVGVEFELDMAGGSDGTWQGRKLFSCPKMRGLFLPVASVIKEKEFYDLKGSSHPHFSNKTRGSSSTPSDTSQPQTNIDLSLAPEPPPPKNKMSQQSRSAKKRNEDDLRLIPRHAVENGEEMSSHHHMHKNMVATSMASSGASVITSTQCSTTDSSTHTSKKQPLAGRHVDTGAQDSSQDCSFSQETTLWTVTSGSVTESGAASLLVNEGNLDENFCNDSVYFGETMVRKSTLMSRSVYNDYSERVKITQPSISTPSSPSLSEYQRHYGKKLSSSSTSTIASDLSKCMSTPGRYSSSRSPYPERKERSGFFGIFRWFRNKKKRSASVDGVSNTSSGSINSLSSTISSSAYSPIIRSKSADIQTRTDTKNQGQFGMTRRYKLFSRNTFERTNSNEENGRRLSVISACSDTSSRPGSRGATLTRKKRQAPQPPGSPKLSDSESLKSHKSCASLPNRELNQIRTPEPSSSTSLDQAMKERKLHKSKSEGVIYSRVKRRAPLPPTQASTGNSSVRELGGSLQKQDSKPPAPSGSLQKTDRPISTVSNISSLSQSLSSASATLKSQSSSGTSCGPSSSQYSAESVVTERGFSSQDITKSSSSPAVTDTGKVTLSPRPWYKRKNKNKDNNKNTPEKEKTEQVYDSWMPEIQFARQKLSLGGSLKKGKTDGKYDRTPQTTKEEKKEKRKSQVSLLANISELDRAASEHIQREQENKQVQKQSYDSRFYRASEPHFLTQTDFLPQAKDSGEVSDMSTLGSSGTGTVKSSTSVKTEMGQQMAHTEIGLYDNLSLSDQDLTLPQSYSKQATLRMEEKEKLQHSSKAEGVPNCDIRSLAQVSNSLEISSLTTNSSSRVAIDADNFQNAAAAPEPSSSVTRDSPMHRATIDAELFYQLAKDTQGPADPKVKSSPVLSSYRETRKLASTSEQTNGGQTQEENVHTADSPSSPRRPNKNFGFRMNNFFSPDVSTIIEASESMTSSATTPADDIYDDLPFSSVTGKGRRESVQDEVNSEINYEFHLNSSDAQEILRELADVKQEIEKINEEEEQESWQREQSKAEKIREEVLLLREANNFQAWHSAVGQNNCGSAEVVTPSPINVSGETNRKLKWVCEMCTLNNLPWRLQCEACMARRPAHPKRVDDDGKSIASDCMSPQASVSNESPVTVIFEDANGNRECSREALEAAGAILPSNEEPLGNGQSHPTDKKKKDINWEKELQKYFRTFDEHVKGNSSENSERKKPATKPSRNTVEAKKEMRGTKAQKSGKESGAAATQSQVKSESESKGAKPKIKFFGTASGPPSTFITGAGTSKAASEGAEQRELSFTVKELHANENLEKEPDMDAIRRARLAKFQGRNEEHVMETHVILNEKKTRNGNYSRATKNSVSESQVMLEVNESFAERKDSMELSNPVHKIQENSPGKSYRKPQVMKPSGAVRTVVSIFNQFEQLQQANKGKPSVGRRKSHSNVTDRTRVFEPKTETSRPELQRARSANGVSKKVKDSYQRDKEVFSAVARFDEMAAIAELESIDKFRQKSKVTRRPKLLKTSVAHACQENNHSLSSNVTNISPKSRRHPASSLPSSPDTSDLCGNAYLDTRSPPQFKETSEGVIKDGVLYTEHKKRSMSISSGAFELIHAEDFLNIEAQHSESSESVIDVTSSTPSADTTQGPVIKVEHMNGDACSWEPSDNSPLVAPETGTEPEVRSQMERNDVERLSHQLTEVEGIATFKANLKVEEPALGHTNTLHIGKLLRRLEGAISRGNHAEAAKLAHDLADFRVSCSVTRNNRNTSTSTSMKSSTNQVDPSSSNHEARVLAPTHSVTEGSGMQASSNISECYYDAEEDMEDEEMSVADHDSLLDAASTSNTEELLQHKENFDLQETSVHSCTDSSVATAVFPGLPQLSQISKPDSPPKPLNDTEPLNGTEPQQVDKETEVPSSVKETPRTSNSPSAARREIRVDPARREVKSDTITKLPEGLHVHMKESKESVQPFYVKMYVEDKNSHQGPLSFAVTPTMTVGQLREKVCQDFGFPPEVQRWILGKRLADDDRLTLEHHRVTSEGCPIFLYLVAPELESQAKASKKRNMQGRSRYGDGDLQAAASGASGTPRYLKVYDDKGNVQYKYYNPDTRRYEVSVDIDNGDLNEGEDDDEDDEEEEEEEEEQEEEEEEEEEDDDDDNEEEDEDDDDDTLEEDDIEEEGTANKKIYHNINRIVGENFDHGKVVKGAQAYDTEDAKYSLSPPTTADSKMNNANNLLNQKNLLNGYPGATSDDRSLTHKNTDVNSFHKQSVINHSSVPSKESEHKHEMNSKHTNQKPDKEQSNGSESPGGNQMRQQDKLQHKQQPQQTQTHLMKGESDAASAAQPQLILNSNKNNSQIGEALQKKDCNTGQQNVNKHQQVQAPSVGKPQSSQSPKMESKSDTNSQSQKLKPQEIHLPSEVNKQHLPELVKQKQQPKQQTPNRSPPEAQASKSKEELPSTSKEHGWVCPSCTLVNKWSRPGCEACATERPGTAHQQASGATKKGSGLGAVVSVLDRQGYVPNPDPFECRVCFLEVESGQGVVLRDCLHTFCRDCLANAIKYSDTADVKCPYRDNQYSCDSSLQDREIKALVTEKEYEQHLNKSVKQAEGAMQNVFHCKTPDCPGFCQFEDNVNEFHCDVCGKDNCLTCQAQHGGITCQEYQDDLANKVDEAAMKTKKFFDDMIRRGDGLPCPKCSVMLVRKWGCDWMRCPMCRTEICWVTRGPRWGPGGPGDVSGGCKCGIRGQKCHPKCTYCH